MAATPDTDGDRPFDSLNSDAEYTDGGSGKQTESERFFVARYRCCPLTGHAIRLATFGFDIEGPNDLTRRAAGSNSLIQRTLISVR